MIGQPGALHTQGVVVDKKTSSSRVVSKQKESDFAWSASLEPALSVRLVLHNNPHGGLCLCLTVLEQEALQQGAMRLRRPDQTDRRVKHTPLKQTSRNE